MYDQIKQRLEQIDSELERMTPNEYADHPATRYFQAKRDFEFEQARQYVQTEGTVDERKSRTILALYDSDAYKALVRAEGEYEGWRAVFRVLDTRAAIGMSLLKAETREAPNTGHQPQWTGRAA